MKLIYSVFFYFLSGFLLLYGQGSPACKTIYIGHESAASGEQVCLDVKVKDFQEMLGLQFTLQWDTAMLEYAGVENFNLPDLLPSNFGATPELLAQGKLTFLWFYITLTEEGFSLPDDATIFTVCFDVKGASGSFAPVFFGPSPAPTELTGWPGPQAFENFLTISGGVFIDDFPATTPLELLSSCTFDTSCDSLSTYTARISGGTPPYSYEWKLGNTVISTTPDLDFFSGGKYQLAVTDANQQVLYVDFSSADKVLNIEASVTDITCQQDTGAIEIEVIGGSGSYSYLWSDSSREASRTGLEAGLYRLTVTDRVSGCVFQRQYELATTACEQFAAELIMSNATVAPNESVCLDVEGNGLQNIKGFDISFSWDTTAVRLDYVTLGNLPDEENKIINYNENGNSFSISRRYEEAVFLEEGSSLFFPCFTSIASGGLSEVVFDRIQTQVIFYNDSIITPRLQNGRVRIGTPDSLLIRVETTGANPEDSVCLAVTSEFFTDITNLQYSLTWDNSILEFQSIRPGIFPTADSSGFINWSVDQNQKGLLTFSSSNPDGITIEDSEVHYYLCFTARRGGVGEVTLASEPLSPEGLNKQGQFVQVAVIPGLVVIGEVPPQAMLRVGENTGRVGEEICVPFTGEQFEGVRKMDFSMQWDTDFIQLSTVNEGSLPAFALSEWNLNHEARGGINVSWQNDAQPVSFFRPQVLLELCFLGVKPGVSQIDISEDYIFESDNPSADPMFLQGGIKVVEQDSLFDGIVLIMPDVIAAEGQSICVPVYANNFNSIAGMQYSHHWDSTVLRLDTVLMGDLPQLSQRNFGFSLGNGNLGVSWTYSVPAEAVTLPDSTTLYSLCFTVIGEATDTSALWIDGHPIPTEVVKTEGSDLILIGLRVEPGNVVISRDFVWPGDTDHNGIANHMDLLNIGLAYGINGPVREAGISIDWEPLSVAAWPFASPLSLVNYKHTDADGNGIIEAADTLAIVNNWGKTTPWYDAPEEEGIVRFEPQQGAPLFVKARGDVSIGKNTFDVILGTEANPAEEVYGLAFSISYDYQGIQSDQVYAGFDSTWLGTLGDDLLTLQRNKPEEKRIDIAITRIDRQNISGLGAIASLHITIEDIILLQGDDDLIVFEIENVRLINALEVDQPTAPTPSSMVVTQQTTPVKDLLDERYIRIFPVPAMERLNIEVEGMVPEHMSVMSPQGTVLMRRSFDKVLELGDLEAGLYFLKLEAQGQAVIKPFVIIH